MNNQLLTLILAVFGGSAAALVTGLLTRPKTRADAQASRAAADVAVSGDSRAWAQFWADAAKAADEKSEEAEEHAEAAQADASRAHRRCDALERHCRRLGEEIVALGGTVPPLPDVD